MDSSRGEMSPCVKATRPERSTEIPIIFPAEIGRVWGERVKLGTCELNVKPVSPLSPQRASAELQRLQKEVWGPNSR